MKSRRTTITSITVLHDPDCPVCRRAVAWLRSQVAAVPIRYVAAGSGEAHQLYPSLDHARTLRQVTVVASDGAVFRGEKAWVVCLWALRDHQAMASFLGSRTGRPVARLLAGSAEVLRHRLASR